ncbi:phage portal protein [Algiphilus sp.]|uniref:phage portal protein n=1 Tax=Algiphilus sp. TaxID=1872431 RepID=UPI0025BAED40|nr:phage portal protein [Algiphilus sp.]MCK5769476.1 phage portal protein [Algiphilus sp.]
MNWWDRAVAYFSPQRAVRNLYYRNALRASGGYEGGRDSRLRKTMRDNRGPNRIVQGGAEATRSHARHLERNYDFARGTLRVFARNVIGPRGIGVEPMPRRADGRVHNEFADQIQRYHREWSRRPEVTGRMTRAMMERHALRCGIRDGEIFSQALRGNVRNLRHHTQVPFSLELLESDFIPFWHDVPGDRIFQGVRLNAWGQPVVYFAHRDHPTDGFQYGAQALKEVPADRMLHFALRDRIHQVRGITIFAAVIHRLEDLKDTTDYELAAAKLASALALTITQQPDELGDNPLSNGQKSEQTGRQLMDIEPAMIYRGQEGEQVNVVDTKRPNQALPDWIDFNLRGIAAGTDGSKSSISRHYTGNFSAQRQELVETWPAYEVMREEFVSAVTLPCYEDVVRTGFATGALRVPSDVDPFTIFDADYRGPAMPWIDPVKEAQGEKIKIRSGLKSLSQAVRERNGDPWEVIDQRAEELAYARNRGVTLDTDPAAVSGSGVEQSSAPESNDPENEQ